MAIGRNSAAARQLSMVLRLGSVGTLSDGELLDRFVNARGEAAEQAFTCLVERHGSMVQRVCRSILRDEHQALDAFQATFLVVARKARSLRVEDTLAPWLQAVSYRVAWSARRSAIRRQKYERQHAEATSSRLAVEPDPGRIEIGELLHEEIAALPERFRVPIVLCDLEGRSHEEAANSLGWPIGTVKSRQSRGRERLKGRLVRRGFTLAIGSGAFFLGQAQGSTVSLVLARQTAIIATRFAVPSNSLGAGVASAPVLLLAKEALMGLLIGKLKIAAILLLAVVLSAAGAIGMASIPPVGSQEPGQATKSKKIELEDVPGRDRPGKIYVRSGMGVVAIDPKNGESSQILIQCGFRPRISPDGRSIAFERDNAIWVRALEKIEDPRKLLEYGDYDQGTPPVWSSDSKKLIISLHKHDANKKHWVYKQFRINADGTGREELPLPEEDGVQDWSTDGWLLTASSRNAEIGWQLYLMKPDGSEQRQITKGGNPFFTRFSPDGRRVVYTDGTTEELRGIWMVDADGQNRRKILSLLNYHSASACFSPDAKRLAVIVFDKVQDGKPIRGRLVLLDVDGKNPTEFLLDEDMKPTDMPDWR